MSERPRLSIVVPFFNEEGNVAAVLAEVRAARPDAEIIAVDDGSTDGTWVALEAAAATGVRALRLPRNLGQSAALYHGIRAARGEWIGTMDGDGQVDPADFEGLLAAAARAGADVAIGWRATREDRWSKRAASRFANALRRAVLRDGARDTGCPLKVFRRTARTALVPFNGMHRFMPALFRAAGLRMVEAPVRHRPRARGISKYTNWGRAWRGLHDLFGVRWLLRRRVLLPDDPG